MWTIGIGTFVCSYTYTGMWTSIHAHLPHPNVYRTVSACVCVCTFLHTLTFFCSRRRIGYAQVPNMICPNLSSVLTEEAEKYLCILLSFLLWFVGSVILLMREKCCVKSRLCVLRIEFQLQYNVVHIWVYWNNRNGQIKSIIFETHTYMHKIR